MGRAVLQARLEVTFYPTQHELIAKWKEEEKGALSSRRNKDGSSPEPLSSPAASTAVMHKQWISEAPTDFREVIFL